MCVNSSHSIWASIILDSDIVRYRYLITIDHKSDIRMDVCDL